jgi:hypothetical protein
MRQTRNHFTEGERELPKQNDKDALKEEVIGKLRRKHRTSGENAICKKTTLSS